MAATYSYTTKAKINQIYGLVFRGFTQNSILESGPNSSERSVSEFTHYSDGRIINYGIIYRVKLPAATKALAI
jgi:hypothetical protein